MAGQFPDRVPLQSYVRHGNYAVHCEQIHGNGAEGVVCAVSGKLQELCRVYFIYQLVCSP